MPTNAPVNANSRRLPARQVCHKLSNTSNIAQYITDRQQLVRLRDMVRELNERHEKPFRWIAAHTWRGPAKFTYWQRIARGGHLAARPAIRPCRMDYLTIESVLDIVRETARAQTEIAISLDEFLAARALADQALVTLLLKSAKRARRK